MSDQARPVNRMWAAAATFCFTLTAAACAANSQPVVLLDKPMTVKVAVPEAVRKAANIVLQLQQVTTPKDVSVTWNIFVELPDADARTPVEAPNFAGYVTTVPNPTARSNPPRGMTLQLPDEAARLVRRLQEARLTFVPVAKFPGEGVRIGAVRLEASQ